MQEVTLDLIRRRTGINLNRLVYCDNPIEPFIRLLEVELLGERQEPFVYEVYSSLWQHIKDVVFGKYVKRFFPVKKKKIEVDFAVLYPRIKCKLPISDMGDRVTLILAGKPVCAFDPSLDVSVMEWRKEVQAKLLTEQRAEWDSCPYCRRSLFK